MRAEELIDHVTLGDHVRLYGYQCADRRYVACYARAIGAPSQAPRSISSSSAASEEEHLQQLIAVQHLCARVHSPFSSQDTRLHNLKVSLMLQ